MGSILTHNNKFFKTIVSKSDYWDFKIALSKLGSTAESGLQTECLSAFIDTDNENCIDNPIGIGEMLLSDGNTNHMWENAVNKGIVLENIGYTGVDNASLIDGETGEIRLEYDKSSITNDEFLQLYSKSSFTIDEGDLRLKLYSVNGNNGIYDYGGVDFVDFTVGDDKTIKVAKLNGGFFQGTFRHGDGCGYNILPSTIDDGWCLEFCLMPKDFAQTENTLNTKHPENKGIFFYIGARSENKWWKYYNVEEEFEETGYEQPAEHNPENEDVMFETSSGINIKSANFTKIESDNGFLLFDRTDEGITSKEYEEGMKAMLIQRKNVETPNLFQYMNRTDEGYTCHNISSLECPFKQKYDVKGDLYENALAFFITEGGGIGYKYFTRNCDCLTEDNIVTEFSNDGIIENDNWYVIDVRILPSSQYNTHNIDNANAKSEKMRMLFYINGVLVLVSKEIPILKLRQLNEISEKQEGVAYNISLGGGTQGLCDVVYSDYKMLPEYILPLEKNFCGSFIGFFKSFKFYTCDKNYEQINANVDYEKANINLDLCWDSLGNITKDTRKEDIDEYTLEKLFGNLTKYE